VDKKLKSNKERRKKEIVSSSHSFKIFRFNIDSNSRGNINYSLTSI